MSSTASSDGSPRCPSCGSPVDPSVRFCTECGTPLRPARVNRSLLAGAVAVAAAAVVAGVMLLGGGDDPVIEGPTIEADPAETTTTVAATTETTTTETTTTETTTTETPTTETPTTEEPTTDVPATVAAPTPVPTTGAGDSATTSPGASLPDPTEPSIGPPGFFPTPDDAIADHLSFVEPPFAGPCEDLRGREAELGGMVTCSALDEDLRPQQVHRWGVFATDDLRGWLFLDVGSAGWSVADESFEFDPPSSWFP